MLTGTHMKTHTHTCMLTNTHMHTNIHTCIHTRAQSNIHARARNNSSGLTQSLLTTDPIGHLSLGVLSNTSPKA